MEQYCFIKIVDILKEEVVTFAVDVMLPNSGKIWVFLNGVLKMLVSICYSEKKSKHDLRPGKLCSGAIQTVTGNVALVLLLELALCQRHGTNS